MNNYNFSMEKVLEWRSTIEKDEMEVFGRLLGDLKNEEDILSDLKYEIQNIKLKSIDETNIHRLQQYNLYIVNMEEKILSQKEKIKEIENSIEVQRSELVLAQKNRSIMENLKEKDFFKYKKNVAHKEQKEIDDIAVIRYISNEAF